MATTTMTTQEYLEHYGRLGMKWYQHRFGDVDGRAKYTEKAKNKEVKAVYKKYSKPLTNEQRAIDKSKAKNRPDKVKKYSDTHKELLAMRKEEIDTVMKMSWEDLMAEKKAVNKWAAAQVAVGTAIGGLGNTFLATSGRRATDVPDYKTQLRTGTTLSSTVIYGPDKDRKKNKRKANV